MLQVSLDGRKPVPVNSVIIYDDGIPAALAQNAGGVVLFADSIRDTEFPTLLKNLGVPPARLHQYGGTIKGKLG